MPRKPKDSEIPEEAVAKEAVTEPSEQQSADEDAERLSIDKMVVFYMAEQRYAIPIGSVQEIQQIVAFSEVPIGFDTVIGMINLRGAVIPALDMRRVLRLPDQDFHVDTPMIICRTNEQLVALVVDEVEDVITLPEGCLAAPPKMHSLGDRMIGVCRMEFGLVYLLDVDRLIERVELPYEGGA